MDLIPFNRNFNSFVDEFFGKTTQKVGSLNMKETDKSYDLEFMLPGFTKDETNVEIEDGYITISAKVEQENKEYDRQEFFKQSFQRIFKLPNDVDNNNISADMENGILFIQLNKKEIKENKKIKIL